MQKTGLGSGDEPVGNRSKADLKKKESDQKYTCLYFGIGSGVGMQKDGQTVDDAEEGDDEDRSTSQGAYFEDVATRSQYNDGHGDRHHQKGHDTGLDAEWFGQVWPRDVGSGNKCRQDHSLGIHMILPFAVEMTENKLQSFIAQDYILVNNKTLTLSG